MIQFTLHEGLFRQSVKVLIGTQDDFNKFMKRNYKYEVGSDNFDGLFVSLPKGEFESHFIYLKYFPETPYSIGVLCHEVLHFVFHICTNSGIKKHKHSEETYTYLHQQLIEKALEKISKFANTKKIEDGKSS